MSRTMGLVLRLILIFGAVLFASIGRAEDALPSWNEGPVKSAIVDFVARVTKEGGADFVPREQRIATFDNDGTLWSEKPVYFQVEFMIYRLKALAPKHPEWKNKPTFKAALEGDLEALAGSAKKDVEELLAVTHSGITTEDFTAAVRDWMAHDQHPRFKRPYTELVFQPMLELLRHLRANAFKTFIVSGGGAEFMRVFAERDFGIVPEQVVGSFGELKFTVRDGVPVLVRKPKVEFVDDGAGKPVGIERFIGRRPIFAFGNSDGDQQMLEWTAAGHGARFVGLVHHTDAVREWAYDRHTMVGKLDKAWDEAVKRGWPLVDMKRDWRVIYPFDKPEPPAAR